MNKIKITEKQAKKMFSMVVADGGRFEDATINRWKESGYIIDDTCNHPREKRSYIGDNMLKCEVCGLEFK